MWIRSQDEKRLIDANKVYICKLGNGEYGLYVSDYASFLIGTYSTEEKAIKVMNLMENHIRCLESYKLHIFEPLNRNDCFIFYMPQDEDVEV